jgi:hypothetical protein
VSGAKVKHVSGDAEFPGSNIDLHTCKLKKVADDDFVVEHSNGWGPFHLQRVCVLEKHVEASAHY